MDNASSATPTVTVKETTEFSVEISNASGCKVTEKVKVAVEKKTDFIDMPDTEVCAGCYGRIDRFRRRDPISLAAYIRACRKPLGSR